MAKVLSKSARALVRYDRAIENAEQAETTIDEVEAGFAATGSHGNSLRGLVNLYLLERECGVAHDPARIAIDIAKTGFRVGRRHEGGEPEESHVRAALTHIYRRSKYNAAAVGYMIAPDINGNPVVTAYKAPVKAARKPALPALPAPIALEAPKAENAA